MFDVGSEPQREKWTEPIPLLSSIKPAIEQHQLILSERAISVPLKAVPAQPGMILFRARVLCGATVCCAKVVSRFLKWARWFCSERAYFLNIGSSPVEHSDDWWRPRLLGTTTCELSIANTSSLLPAEGPSDPELGRDTYIIKDLASKVSQSGIGLKFLLLVKAIEHLRILHTSVDVVRNVVRWHSFYSFSSRILCWLMYLFSPYRK